MQLRLWLLFCLVPFSLAASPIRSTVIKDVRVLGTLLQVQLETKAGQAFRPKTVERDVRRIWASGKFADIRVEAVDTAGGLVLAFNLLEKRQYTLRKAEFEPQKFQQKVSLEEGAKLDEVETRKLAADLRRQLVEEGYPGAEVKALLIPVDPGRADLHVNVRTGRHEQVRKVHFSGEPGLPAQKLRKALQANRVARMLPGIPRLWKGWRSHPGFSERGAAADLARLKALYFSEGYLSPHVELVKTNFSMKGVDLTIETYSGPRYRVEKVDLEVAGSESGPNVEIPADGSFPHKEICRCLRELKGGFEKEGRLGFEVDLQIQPSDEPTGPEQSRLTEIDRAQETAPAAVSLKAKVSAGEPYRVGRIEFQADESVNDLTLRRAMTIEEGDLFDWGKVRKSVARLNRLGLTRPVREENLRVLRRPGDGTADLIVSVNGVPRGRWSLSGPAGFMNPLNRLNFTLGSRLPNWGKKPWELTTYFLSISLLSFPQAVIGPSSIVVTKKIAPLFALSRPFLPGQGWRSGFVVSPQLGWAQTLENYGLIQLRERSGRALSPPLDTEIIVPVSWSGRIAEAVGARPSATGVLVCEPPKPSWHVARTAVRLILDWYPLLLLL